MKTNMEKSGLGDRMKRYEDVNRHYLIRRTPVIIRLDGKAFHSFTKGLERPFDEELHKNMVHTMYMLVSQIQGAVLAYTQSDEISILIRDWDTLNTDAWFDYNIQKMVSVSASIATAEFNYAWSKRPKKIAHFDSRVFNLPKEEVCNYFIWRQQDASRNSVNMLAQSLFSHKELQGKNVSEVQDMMMMQKSVNWNDCKTWQKRGTCTYRTKNRFNKEDMDQLDINDPSSKSHIMQDFEIPIFTQDRNYVEQHLVVENE